MASLFWVAGTAVYDGTTNRFATTTGGSATIALVTSADDVTFDGSSPAAAAVTTSAAISCKSLTLAAGFTGSLTMSNSLTATGAITLTQGTLNTNGQTVSTATFKDTGTAARTLTMGASNITCTSSGSSWSFGSNGTTGLTVTANTATVTCNGGSGTFQTGGVINYNGTSVVLTGSGTVQIGGGNCTLANLTRTGTPTKTDLFQFTGGAFTITGTLTINGNSTVNRVLVSSGTVGSPHTVTAAAVSLSNVDFMDMAFANSTSPGTKFTGTSLGDCQGNSGDISFTTPATQTHTASAGGNWSDVTKWTSRVPLPQDNVVVDVNTTGTLTMDMPRLGADLTFTGCTANLTGGIATSIFGSVTLASGLTINLAGFSWTLSGRSSHTFTSAGNSLNATQTFAGPGGTYTLQDAFSNTFGSLIVTDGTFTTNNNAVTCSIFSATSGRTTVLNLGTSIVTLTTTTAVNIFNGNIATTTVNSSTATFVVSTVSTLARTINLRATSGNVGTITYTVANSSGPLVITTQAAGAITIGSLNVGDGRIVQFASTSTTTITNFNVNGSLGNSTGVNAVTAGSAATLALPVGTTTCNFIVFKDIAVTGGTINAVNGQLVSGTSGITVSYARSAVPSTTPRTPSNYLFLPGTSSNFAATPNAASLQITGDIDMRAYCRMANWKVPLSGSFIGKWGTSPQRGYDFEIVANTGVLRMSWSTDGTGAGSLSMASTVATGLQSGQASWVRTTLQVNDGSGNRVAKFYLSTDGITWNQLGTTVTTVGTTNIFASTNQMEVAHVTDNVNAWRGDMYYAEVRNGINGSIVANPDFRLAGSSGFTDSAGNVWTVSSAAPAPAQLVRRT